MCCLQTDTEDTDKWTAGRMDIQMDRQTDDGELVLVSLLVLVK